MDDVNDGVRALALAFVMAVSYTVAPAAFYGSGPVGAASASGSSANFHVVDAGNVGGGVAVVLEANTTDQVDTFEFEYDNGSNKETGLTIGNGVSAEYPNKDPYDQSQGISQSAGTPDRAIFYLDAGKATYVTDQITINATAGGSSYSNANPENRSVATVNWLHVSPKSADGTDTATVVPLAVQKADTNESYGHMMVQPGSSRALICQGVDQGGTCMDPDDGSTATRAPQTWSWGGDRLGQATAPPWQSSSPVALTGYNLATANATERLTGPGTKTPTTSDPGVPVIFQALQASDGSQLSVDSIEITDVSSGNVVYQSGDTGAPAFLRPATPYEVKITNSGTFGTETRSLTVPTKGMTEATFAVNTGLATSTVTGQIVDENGDPVEHAVVMAEQALDFSNGYRFFNSSTTDANGVFSMALPETAARPGHGRYQFTFVSNETDGGTVKYYPTTDDNDGLGYQVRSSKTVLPPMTMESGGEVSVSLSQQGGGKIQPGTMTTTLGKYTSRTGERTRSAVSESFSQISFPGQTNPSSAEVELMSPTTNADTRVGYNVWGLGGNRPGHVCANDVSVSQGSTTESSCTVANAAYINLSVDEYTSVVQRSSATSAPVADSSFFFENELLVRDSSTGDVVTYLGRGSAQMFLLGTGGPNTNVTIPVPADRDYELELRPADEWVRSTTVNDTSTVSVTAGSTTDVTLDRGDDFQITPIEHRVSKSLDRSGGNTVAANVTDPLTEKGLTASDVTVTAHFADPNGTKVTSRVDLTANATAGDGVFDTKSLDPSSLSLDAGTYDLVVTASNTSGTRTYNTTRTFRVAVSDFRTAIDVSSDTVAPGDKVVGTIKAYDTSTSPPSGVSANARDVDIEVYDDAGTLVTSESPTSDVSSGEGSFSVSMPSDAGYYRVLAFVDDGAGNQGVAERWVRASEVDVDVETDKGTYRATETVEATVTVSNATDGTAIEDASVELSINGNTVGDTTDGNGEVTVALDPGSYADGATSWQDDNFVVAKAYVETDAGVVQKTAGTGFRVQSFNVRARPVSSTFADSDPVVFDVAVDPSVTANAVAVTGIDGQELDSPVIGTKEDSGYYQVDVGTQPVGDHTATVTVLSQSGSIQETRVRYRVRSNSIAVDTDKLTYDTGEGISVDVTVRDTSGNPVSSESVTATLYAAESPPRQVAAETDTTGSDGSVTLTGLSSSSPGHHFVEVDVGGQKQYAGLMVSDLSVQFEDDSDNAVDEYEVAPGDTKTVHVDATSNAGSVSDGSPVAVGVLVHGEVVAQANAEIDGSDGDVAVDLPVPADVSAGTYPVVARVQTGDGNVGSTSATLNVTGGTALTIDAAAGQPQYAPGDTATLRALVTDASGSPVDGKSVVFVLDAEGTASEKLATATTGSDGIATHEYAIPSDKASGEYVIETRLADASRTRDYSGFTISDLNVGVSVADPPYEPGQTMTLTVDVTDDSGSAVDADAGELRIVMPTGNEITQSFDTTGQAPYEVDFTVPNDGTSVGELTVAARASRGQASAGDATLVDVENGSETATLSVPDVVTAGESVDLTLSSSVDETAVLTVFPPDASAVAVNRSVALTANTDATESVTLSTPGTYVFKLSVPGVGTVTEVREVEPSAGTDHSLTVGTAVGDSTDTFSTTEDVYVQSDAKGTTAEILTDGESYEVSLTQQQGDTYYGVLRQSRSAGAYMVRLDSDRATAVNETLIRVES